MTETEKKAHPLPYRPDIDGLRAIAVLLVIACHVFPSHMLGGLIGVDVLETITSMDHAHLTPMASELVAKELLVKLITKGF